MGAGVERADLTTITIEPRGLVWVVRHNDGYLGEAASEAEALAIARSLVAWARSEGRTVRLVRVGNGATPPARTPEARDGAAEDPRRRQVSEKRWWMRQGLNL